IGFWICYLAPVLIPPAFQSEPSSGKRCRFFHLLRNIFRTSTMNKRKELEYDKANKTNRITPSLRDRLSCAKHSAARCPEDHQNDYSTRRCSQPAGRQTVPVPRYMERKSLPHGCFHQRCRAV